jgi:hypothetical protein
MRNGWRAAMRLRIDWRVAVVLAGLALVCGNAGAQSSKVTWDKNFNFGEHTRYAWKKNHLVLAQSPDDLALLDKAIMQSVNQKLKPEGFTEDEEKPDFFIFYEADTMGGISGGGGPAVNPNAGYSRAKVGGIAPSSSISVVAAISFHMVDAHTGKPIWDSFSKRKIRDPNKEAEKPEIIIADLTEKIFKDFPPKK